MAGTTRLDPAADAAKLLRRIGFGILMIALPLAAMFSRRGAVIVMPVGAVLLLLALLVDPEKPPIMARLRRAAASPAVAAFVALCVWAVVSISFTAFPKGAIERAATILGTVLLAAATVWTLPEKMRASTLNLVPIGAFVGALAATATAVLSATGVAPRWLPNDPLVMERGLAVLSLVSLAGIGWLLSRGRWLEAGALAIACAAAIGARADLVAGSAFATGAAVFALARLDRRITAWLVILAAALVLFGAPALALLGSSLPGFLAEPLSPLATVLSTKPPRLLPGLGFDMMRVSGAAGALPESLSRTLPVDLWYELGLLGALGALGAFALAARAAASANEGIAAAALGLLAAGFVYTCLGVNATQVWWISSLGVAAVALKAIERGQFRTTRPRARAPVLATS